MKRRCSCFLAAVTAALALAQWTRGAEGEKPRPEKNLPIHVSVDPRIELISIIFRLAGNREYTTDRIASYNRDVDAHFGPHKSHPAILFATQLRRTRGVSFDAPMSLAVHLADAYTLETKVPFTPRPPGLDSRWPDDGVIDFLKKARAFVRDADFKGFFDAHQPLYDESTRRAREFLRTEFRSDWFDGFFGARPGARYHVVLGMLNGGGNYGVRLKVGDREDLYSILGVSYLDEKGMPVFDRRKLPTLVHEFCHSYTNPLVDKYAEDLEGPGQKIFPHCKARMQRMAYADWRAMMYESLVRACVIRYLNSENPKAAEERIAKEKKRGFLWIGDLSDLLGQYEANRDAYPTLDQFFPKIVGFFEEYAKSPILVEPEKETPFWRQLEKLLGVTRENR